MDQTLGGSNFAEVMGFYDRQGHGWKGTEYLTILQLLVNFCEQRGISVLHAVAPPCQMLLLYAESHIELLSM